MTREDIIRLAEEAGFDLYMFSPTGRDNFERFAALVAYEEREACAMACERPEPVGKSELRHRTHRECAAAIRKRGERP
jgi:hypothetical protein